MKLCALRSLVAGLAGMAAFAVAPASAASLFVHGFEDLPAFAVEPAAVTVPAATLQTRCYYFRAPVTPQAIGRIASLAGPGVAHLILHATYDNAGNPQERQPPGTWAADCSALGLSGWLHVAPAATAEVRLPEDDGTGKKVAFALAGGQPLVLQVRLVNVGDQPMQAQVALAFEARHPAQDITPTASYIADNLQLSIPPNSIDVESRACAVPPAVHFWRFTARTHKQGSRLRVLAGATTLADGTDWENPPVTQFDAPPFHAFVGPMTYECTYSNPTTRTLARGSNEDVDEVCLGVGWFFPATRPMHCITNVGPL